MKERLFTAIAILAVAGVLLAKHVELADTGMPAPKSRSRERAGQESAGSPPVVFYAPGKRPAAPKFSLDLLGGGKVTSESLRGSVVMINFWATWCAPCVEEIPSLDRLNRALEAGPFKLLAVNVDEDRTAPARLFSRLVDAPGGKVPGFTVALDPGGRVAARFGTVKFPETYLLDGEGKILVKFIGPRDWSNPMYIKLLQMVSATGSIPMMGTAAAKPRLEK